MITIATTRGPHNAVGGLPEIWCVIPHYGGNHLLERCRDSLQHVEYPTELFNDDHIVVVNNNPPNQNVLFTRAVNTGIGRVRLERKKSPLTEHGLIFLLNNDTVVEPECFIRAVDCFNELGWDTTGMVGPKNVRLDNTDRIFWGGSLRAYPGGRHKTGFVSRGDLGTRTEEEWITFSGVFLNEWMIDQIGVLDVNLRHIGSDSDYCFRARMQGWKLYYEPKSVIHHAVGSSNRDASPSLRRVMKEDMQYFAMKWIQPGVLYRRITRYSGM